MINMLSSCASVTLSEGATVQDLPLIILGDVVISLDSAARQAQERQALYGLNYGTHAEARVLLLHGFLHLLGFDHEAGQAAEEEMQQQEVALMQEVGWEGKGLVEMAAFSSEADGSAEVRAERTSSGAPSRAHVLVGSLSALQHVSVAAAVCESGLWRACL